MKVHVNGDVISAQLPFNVVTAFYFADVRVSMMTEVGLPVTMQAQVSASEKVNGTIDFEAKMALINGIPGNMGPNGSPRVTFPDGVKMSVDLSNK